MQKARRHHTKWLRPLAGAWFQGLFHSSVRGPFHLSLTVLVRYRSLGSIQPSGMVPGNSTGIPRVPAYSGAAPVYPAFRVPASHRLRGRVPSPSATLSISFGRSYYPGTRRNAAGLGSSHFARRYSGNRSYFLFLRVLRCFSSPRSPPPVRRMWGSLPTGCPIRTSADHSAFATPRSFSQLVTSFLASESQGIPHAPFFVPLFLSQPNGLLCVSEPCSTFVRLSICS